MPKISPNGGKSLTPINVPILEEFIRGSPKRGRNFPKERRNFPQRGRGKAKWLKEKATYTIKNGRE